MAKEKAPVVFPDGLHPMTAKKIGNSVIVNTLKEDGSAERLSRQMTKDEFAKLTGKLELYNKKPTVARKAEITKLMAPAATAKKATEDKTKVATKAVEKKIKKEEKKGESKSLLQQLEEELSASPESVAAFQKVLNKFKVEEKEAPKAQETKKPRRQEVYRNGMRSYIWVNEAGVEVKQDGSPLTS